jgi:hypothetical protein
MASPSWLRGVVAALIVLTAVLTSGTHRGGAPALADDTGGEEPAEEADPAEVAIGERLFLETSPRWPRSCAPSTRTTSSRAQLARAGLCRALKPV